MLRDHRLTGQDLDHTTAADLHRLPGPGERHRVLSSLEAHQAVQTHATRHHLVERLGQHRQRCQVTPLGFPCRPHAGPRRRAPASFSGRVQRRIAPRLQRLERVPVLVTRVGNPALRAHVALDLALVLRRTRQTRVDVEAQHHRVAPVGRVQLAPGARAPRHRRLRVVHPHHRRHAAEPFQRPVVAPQPAQLILPL